VITIQSLYNDLVEQVFFRDSIAQFPPGGSFFKTEYRNTTYWYYRLFRNGEEIKKYVGKESPQLLEMMKNHEHARMADKMCRQLANTLRGSGCVLPAGQMGAVAQALADAGFFRLRGVLVGTLAFQCYPAMLGESVKRRTSLVETHVHSENFTTGDVDFAQFQSVSVAVRDNMTESFQQVLQKAGNFLPVRTIGMEDTRYTRWRDVNTGCFVDLLVPLTGKDEKAVYLPSSQAYGAGLRFLDFLIYDERRAVIPYKSGIGVNVPAPERYAVHKLIVSRNRDTPEKREKDVEQSAFLLEILLHTEKSLVLDTVREAADRGKGWKKRLVAGAGKLPDFLRGEILEALKAEAEHSDDEPDLSP
jgi:hypothetical protein